MSYRASVLLAATLLPLAVAAGDPIAGKEKSATCAACHGADGVSSAPTFPTLAGQHETYLVQSLKQYRDGSRKNAVMAPMAANLSDEDIADLAAFYARQKGPLKTVKY
ncbi:MAG: cytochrome c [Oceanococcaceae bacterium]